LGTLSDPFTPVRAPPGPTLRVNLDFAFLHESNVEIAGNFDRWHVDERLLNLIAHSFAASIFSICLVPVEVVATNDSEPLSEMRPDRELIGLVVDHVFDVTLEGFHRHQFSLRIRAAKAE